MGGMVQATARSGKGVKRRMLYERPEILATYSEEELVEEAAVCVVYEPGGGIPT